MGQKVNPIALRLGVTEPFRAHWYARKGQFGQYVVEDHQIRRFIKRNYYYAGITRIDIERTGEAVRVTIHTARPGLVIGRKGSEIDRLKTNLQALVGRPADLVIQEVTRPELEAQLVAENVAQQLEKRSSFRRTLHRSAEATMQSGALGVKIQVSGRLGGSEMSRREHLIQGSIPLHTISADISYGFAEARTTYGQIGVKCWIYRGRVIPGEGESEDTAGEETGHGPHA
jgi:small subunit ribosomal protein S3